MTKFCPLQTDGGLQWEDMSVPVPAPSFLSSFDDETSVMTNHTNHVAQERLTRMASVLEQLDIEEEMRMMEKGLITPSKQMQPGQYFSVGGMEGLIV